MHNKSARSLNSGRKAVSAWLALVIMLSLVGTLVGCGGGGADRRAVALAQVQGDFHGEWPVKTYVARTPAEWAQIWTDHTPMAIPSPKMPEIDFSANTVVGVALGWRTSGCYGMQITRVTEDESEVIVEYQETTPPPGLACAAVMVFLVDFATIPTTNKPVNFVQVH